MATSRVKKLTNPWRMTIKWCCRVIKERMEAILLG
ncbi:hypothetical protein MUK42_36103 [Musa troglodytarum]|uniref:Uncharacterized protein n=1 Tax=Musa troglodytarum TaxID=320322 RepID=A0A9E7FH25_9LILI|nr:hypothetical protein MUK42_36103 [Musa troglodytarum]